VRLLIPVARYLHGLRRPSKATSVRRLRERGETLESLTIREATADDIPALARLHVQTFRETHGGGPTPEIREWQYRQKFAETNGSWFAFVATRPDGTLVGFAVGQAAKDDPKYEGNLNKIYVLRAYHRLGLGRRLVGHVVRRFLSQGITSMTLFSQADNPSIAFFEAIGGERRLNDTGGFDGAYGFKDMRTVAERCPAG
jgi:ribosomal protein S18 acetylase RimI-like enzyme